MIWRCLLGLPKSIMLNFCCLPFAIAIRMPILVSKKTRLGGVNSRTIYFQTEKIRTGMIRIGIVNGSEGIITDKRCFFGIESGGKIIFKGKFDLAPGGTLKVSKDGEMIIGNNVSFNFHCTLLCKKKIVVGDNVLFGWDVLLNDGDGHFIYNDLNEWINQPKEIVIDDGVWIASNVTILKGSKIGKRCIVGYGSLVTKEFNHSHAIIAGNPAKVVKEKINWVH